MKRMGIRQFLPLIFLLFFTLLNSCNTSQSPKTYTVGIVSLNPQFENILTGFKKGLAESGYVEGKNITFIYPGPRSDVTELEKDLHDLIERKVDLIFALSTPAAREAKLMTAKTGIPVVFGPVFDPVGAGIVKSLLHPGGNLTCS